MPDKMLKAVVHGSVQGVSYRFFAVREATRLGLTGYVRNLEDNSVEVVAEGSEENIRKLLAELYKGSPAASIDRIDKEFSAANGKFRTFSVKY